MLYARGTSSKVLIVVASLAVLAAFFYWRRSTTPLATTDPAVAPSPSSSSPSPSSSLAHPPAPSPPPTAAGAPPAAASPEAQFPEAPPETAEVLDRLSTTLMAAARPCGAALRSADDPAQQLRFRIDVAGAEIRHLGRVEGALPPGVAECIEEKWHAARFAAVAAPVTLQLDVAVRDLR